MLQHVELICVSLSRVMFPVAVQRFAVHQSRRISAAREVNIVAARPARSESRDAIRDAQKAWLDQIKSETGQSLRQIAQAAGVDPTVLTRLRNSPSYKGVLSPLTVRSIAEATKTRAPTEIIGDTGADSLREREADPYVAAPDDPLASSVAHLLAGHAARFAWRVNNRVLEYEGVRPGDVLIVDLNAAPLARDLVCAQLYDWERPGAAETVFRLYEPPFLLASGPEEGARKPRLVDNDAVVVKGVVVATLRGRQGRPT